MHKQTLRINFVPFLLDLSYQPSACCVEKLLVKTYLMRCIIKTIFAAVSSKFHIGKAGASLSRMGLVGLDGRETRAT